MSVLRQGLQRYLTPVQLAYLQQVRVGIAGAGGLGSNCAVLLLRSGISRFTLVDYDKVEPSNLNRQHFFPDDVGKPKVVALAEQLRRLEPNVELITHELCLDAGTAPVIFADCAVVVEAFDLASAKAMLVQSLLAGLAQLSLLVCASGLAGSGGLPIRVQRINPRLVMVGDGQSAVSDAMPPLAPRVMQAAALQADVVLDYFLQEVASATVS